MTRFGKRASLLCLFLTLAALGGRLVWNLALAPDADKPVAKLGVLDLRQWSFAAGGSVPLDGQWMFYSGRLLAPEQLAADDGNPGGLPVPERLPGSWDDYVSEGASTPFGYGTYHLVIRLDGRETGIFGIRTSIIRTANKLYINGRQVGASGEPAADRRNVRPENTPYLALFPISGDRVDVVLQVANYDYALNGGALLSLVFGPADGLLKERQLDDLADSSLAGLLLFLAAYFAFMYFRARSFREFLSFAAYCLFFALYVLTHGEKLGLRLLPALPFEWVTKLQTASFVLCGYMFYLFARAMNPGFKRYRAEPFVHLSSAAALAIILLTEARVYSRFESAFGALALLIVFYAVYWLIRSAASGKTDAVWELIGVTGMLYYFLSQNKPYLGFSTNESFPPFAVIINVLIFAVIVSRRFDHVLDKTERLSRKLNASDRAKDEFLADASRELKTPLNAMLQLLQPASRRHADADSETERLSNERLALSAGERLRFLLDELSEVSLLEEGRLSLDIRPVRLRDAVEDAVQVLRLASGPLPLRMDNRIPADAPRIAADGDRLTRMLLNLLYDAIQHVRRGTVAFEAERLGDALEIRFFAEPSEALAASAASDSTLRLYLFRRIAELQGGTVALRQTGAGYAVTFAMPLAAGAGRRPSRGSAGAQALFLGAAEAAAAADSRGAEQNRSASGAGRILLVESDSLTARALQHLLQADQYFTLAVTRGDEALKQLRARRDWDAVILDIALPDRSGFEVCRELRKTYPATALPVLMLTSRSRRSDLLAGFASGATDFASLPFDAEEFGARVRTLVGLKRSARMLLRAEMAFLQAQIKPHFLFNAINTILAVSSENVRGAQQLLIDLGTYLRNSFDFHSLEEEIPLYRELELTDAYLKIEQARFGGRLQVFRDIQVDANERIPPLVLQPIVENAVRHGATGRPEGGWVKVEIRPDELGFTMTVTDNGPGFDPKPPERIADDDRRTDSRGEGVGLSNIAGRLRALGFDPPEIDSRPGQGTTVTMRLGRRRRTDAKAHLD